MSIPLVFDVPKAEEILNSIGWKIFQRLIKFFEICTHEYGSMFRVASKYSQIIWEYSLFTDFYLLIFDKLPSQLRA